MFSRHSDNAWILSVLGILSFCFVTEILTIDIYEGRGINGVNIVISRPKCTLPCGGLRGDSSSGNATMTDQSDRVTHYQPRTIFYFATPVHPSRPPISVMTNKTLLDPTYSLLRVAPGEDLRHSHGSAFVQDDCVPMQEWQASILTNCNAFHELDMKSSRREGKHQTSERQTKLLGWGGIRMAWKVALGPESSNAVVLKTLRLDREFSAANNELNRKDAAAMEHLSPSPYVIDAYGFCGQSSMNELAINNAGKVANLQSFLEQLRGKVDDNSLLLKLHASSMLAIAVAQIHDIDGRNNATMIHHDLHSSNVLIVNGRIKLHDFNLVEFMQWNRLKQKRCGFRASTAHHRQAPEELVVPRKLAEATGWNSSLSSFVGTFSDQPILDEKVDVWALGLLLFETLTGREVKRPGPGAAMDMVCRDVLNAKVPWSMPDDMMYLKSTHPATVAMRRAIGRCIVKNPEKRWPARKVARELLRALNALRGNNNMDLSQVT